MREVVWGIIGCGSVCEVKSGPAFNKVPYSRLQAVMRRTGSKAEDYARRHGVPEFFTDADKIINHPEINAVYIATPPNRHAEYAIKAAEAGKAVYVEKPMARSYQECLEMIEACKKHNVPLYVAYYRRTLPYFLKIKELINDRVIGDIQNVQIQLVKQAKPDNLLPADQKTGWRTEPSVSGGGYFHDLGTHQLDLLEYLLGPVAQADGIAINKQGWYRPADQVKALLKFESGCTGLGSWDFTATVPGAEMDYVIIQGSNGIISFSTFNGDIPVRLRSNDLNKNYQLPYPEHVQQPLIETIVASLRGGGNYCPSDGYSGSRASLLAEEITG